jgi:hypothetical protein
MNVFIFAVIVRGVLSLAVIVGGVFAIFVGGKLYRSGVGVKKDGSAVEFPVGNAKARARMKTVGATVMITSVLWAGISYLLAPSIKADLGRPPNDQVGIMSPGGSVSVGAPTSGSPSLGTGQVGSPGDAQDQGLVYFELSAPSAPPSEP